jgi:hypothetical protein
VIITPEWRHTLAAWALILPIIAASAFGLDAVASLRGPNTVWDNVSNPRHDPVTISRAVADDQDNAQQ